MNSNAKAASAAKARDALRRAVLVSKLTTAPLTGRRAVLVGQMASKKSLENFLGNWKITGAAPTNILKRTTKETSINNAWRFLKKPMLVPVGGSKYPNKINWKGAVNSLGQYNLTNAQKNLIRRVNIAIAAQPKKGSHENRKSVKIIISNKTRDNAIKAQIKAIKNEEQRTASNNPFFENNKNVFHNARQTFNNPTFNMNEARQHREAFGN